MKSVIIDGKEFISREDFDEKRIEDDSRLGVLKDILTELEFDILCSRDRYEGYKEDELSLAMLDEEGFLRGCLYVRDCIKERIKWEEEVK